MIFWVRSHLLFVAASFFFVIDSHQLDGGKKRGRCFFDVEMTEEGVGGSFKQTPNAVQCNKGKSTNGKNCCFMFKSFNAG